jgi:hypothetical protein
MSFQNELKKALRAGRIGRTSVPTFLYLLLSLTRSEKQTTKPTTCAEIRAWIPDFRARPMPGNPRKGIPGFRTWMSSAMPGNPRKGILRVFLIGPLLYRKIFGMLSQILHNLRPCLARQFASRARRK